MGRKPKALSRADRWPANVPGPPEQIATNTCLKTAELYPRAVPEARNLESGGGGPFLPRRLQLLVFARHRRGPGFVDTSLISGSIVTRVSRVSLLCPNFPLSIRTFDQAHPNPV